MVKISIIWALYIYIKLGIIEGLYIYNYFALTYLLIIGTIYFILCFVSFRVIRKYSRKITYVDIKDMFRYGNTKAISVIVPAYNEGNSIINSTSAFLQLEYPDFHVIVVNDGSKDDTLHNLISHFSMEMVPYGMVDSIDTMQVRGFYKSKEHPSLLVIDKENGGKADAINAGINVSKDPLICVIDADSILERDCLLKVVRPFIEDENVVAVGGIVRIANGCKVEQGRVLEIAPPKKFIGKFQVVEYLRAFLFGRTGFDSVNAMLIISGAFGCFSKDAVLKVGGYRVGCIGEDMELVVRMHKMLRRQNPNTRITFVPDPVCWTEAPETLKVLKSQRIRWQKGTIQSILLHKDMFLNADYGWVGFFAFPYFMIFEMLGPFVEFSGYIVFALSALFGIVSLPFAITFLTVAILYGMVLSVTSVILEELSFKKYPKTSHLLHLFCAAFLENIGYRQLQTWWRFRATIEYAFGSRGWGKMEKKGLGK